MDYWEKKYREKEAQENFNGCVSGVLALIFAFGMLTFISLYG